jgi:hypothetical protein
MILGQAAGVAASIAIHKKVDVQDVPVTQLQQQLLVGHAILHWPQTR